MAKYNLLDDDDIFEEEKEDIENSESVGKKDPSSQNQELEINIDDDFDIEPASLSDDEFKTDVRETDIDVESQEVMEKEPEELDENPHFDDYEDEEPKKKTTTYYEDEYDDFKQEGVNFGPIIKILVVIVILGGIYFLLDYFVFSDSEGEVVEQQEPVKTPEQIRQEQEAAAKAEFLSNISGKINSDVRFVTRVVNGIQKSAKLSSALYYGNTFLVQIFGNTRNEVAKAQMSLKQSGVPFEIISSEVRPGSKGGVLNTYSIDVNNSSTSSGQATATFASIADFEGWINRSSSSNGLKVGALSNKVLNEESNFQKYEIVTTLKGSVDGCNSFLQQLSTDGAQIKIHKLNLSAFDQRTFKPGNYQLKLILELFI